MHPIRDRVVLAAFFVLAPLAAGCGDGESEKETPDAGRPDAGSDKGRPDTVTVFLSTAAVDADSGSLTVTVIALEQGVPLLEYPVTVSITGPAMVPAQDVLTDSNRGAAVAEFSDLTTAGDYTVTATARDVQASVGFSVTHGSPDALAFQLATGRLNAGESTTWDAEVTDARGNILADPAILVTTTAPGASYATPDSLEFTRAGSYVVRAELPGTELVATDTVDVVPAEAAQILTALDRSVVGQLQTLRITCTEMDAFGNDTGAVFTAADISTDDPSATVTAVAGTSNAFEVSGFGAPGARTATCANGMFDDSKSFHVVSQAASHTVVATLSQNVADYQGTLVVTCRELDAFGATVPTEAGGFLVTFPTDPSAGAAQAAADPGDMDATDGIDFVISGLAALGEYEVRCDAGGQSDLDDFFVADLTAPEITAAGIAMASGPNGTTTDHAYAPGTLFGVDVSATDAVGVVTLEIRVDSGPGTANDAMFFPGGPPNANAMLDASVDATASTLDSIVYEIIARDAAGNTTTLTLPRVTVDPAVAFAVATGVTMRTYYESSVTPGENAYSIGTDGIDLFVQRARISDSVATEVLRFTGDVGPVTPTVEIGPPFPSQGVGIGSVVATTGTFGGFSVFHALGSQIGTTDGGAHVTFANAALYDMTLVDLGQGMRIFYTDTFGGISRVDASGATAPYATGSFVDFVPLTNDGSRLLTIDPWTGAVFKVVESGSDTGTMSALTVDAPFDGAIDVAAFGSHLIACRADNVLARYDLAPAADPTSAMRLPDITTALTLCIGLAVKSSGTLYVLDNENKPDEYTIYAVTGY